MKYFISLFVLMFAFSTTANAETTLIKYKNYQIPVQTSDFNECTDGKPRVIVTSDISNRSDPDDIQSMVHLLATSNQFKTLGLISTPGGSRAVGNEKFHLQNMVNAYALDHARSNPTALKALGYPQPSELSQVIRQGAKGITNFSAATNTPIYNASNPLHQGAKLILDEANKILDGTNCGPLYVLVWGSIPDVALALKESKRRVAAGIDRQGIEKVLRVYFIASSNKTAGQPAYNYIYDNFLTKDLLWFIQSEQTFRGINNAGFGGPSRTTQQNFLNSVKNRGCLGYVLNQTGIDLDNKEDKPVKVGDTPSLLYVMNGDLDDPTSSSWGGQYKQVPGHSNWWVDGHVNDVHAIKTTTTNNTGTFAQKLVDGKTVGDHIPSIYADWRRGMQRFSASLPGSCVSTVYNTLN